VQINTLILLIVLSVASNASASSLFEEDTVLEVRLSGPLTSLLEDKDDGKELPFLLHADDTEHSVKVRLRGKSRKIVCDFPPLRINFKVSDTELSIFEGQDKLKLATQCQQHDSAEADILQEYAAYRIFNLISEFSYRVRLLHVTYTNTEGRPEKNTFTRYGFLIESSSELADRVGGQLAHVTGVSLSSLDSKQAATVFIFQYLIGNTDWSLVTADKSDRCCHNGDVFDVGSVRYYVPYDFDLSGLVNARYARPDPSLRIRRVTQRLYRGHCIPIDAVENALRDLKSRRVDILNEIGQVPGLSQKEIESMTEYIERFFAEANNESKILRSFERNCL